MIMTFQCLDLKLLAHLHLLCFWNNLLLNTVPHFVKLTATKNLKIKFHDLKGQPKTVLCDEETKWLLGFFVDAEIHRQTPGCKDAVYVSEPDGVQQYKQKTIFMMDSTRNFAHN